MASTYTLTVSCPDQRGIIAAVTQILAQTGANVLNLSQHTATDINMFFLRLVFETADGFSEPAFRDSFTPLGEMYQMEWKLWDQSRKARVAILVSKTSHCLYELLLKHQDGELDCEFPVIISNHGDLASVATQFHIPYWQVDPLKGKLNYEADMNKILEDYKIDMVVMARYMQVLSKQFTAKWDHKVINIHHGFLPAFMGAKPYHQAWYKGVKIIGATAHFANEDLDQGPIIYQDTMRVSDSASINQFVQLGKDIERRTLYQALRLYLNHSVFVHGGRTFVLN